MSLLPDAVRREAFAEASRFRGEFYECLTARRDELFELSDAVLCADGAVKSPVDLTLLPEHRRGHGAMYGGLNHGRIDVDRLRTVPAGLPLPRFDGGRLVLAVDVSPWLRSDAPCSADRLFCHVYGRTKTASQFIPGWPYSFVAVLEPGATSWTAILDAVRLGPVDDATAVTVAQPRGVVEKLVTTEQWQAGDPDIVIVSDAGYDVTRLAWVLRDLPVELVGRVRSDRVMRLPKPPRLRGVNGLAAQARPGIPPHQAGDLAGARDHHRHRHHELRESRDPGMGPGPPPAHPPRGLARPRRRTPPDRRHVGPAEGRALIKGPGRATGVVVVLEDRRRPGRRRPFLAGLPAQIRP
ncbi:transposase [Streptomyces sp. ITFR-6]|nr:transposase [Streptomyces sp. ITFR-6]WNI30213.1 transposase [Streptomyces sp. ITFR-6]